MRGAHQALAGRRHIEGQECQGEGRCVSHDALNGELLATAGRTVPVRRRSAIEMNGGGSSARPRARGALRAGNRPSVDVAFGEFRQRHEKAHSRCMGAPRTAETAPGGTFPPSEGSGRPERRSVGRYSLRQERRRSWSRRASHSRMSFGRDVKSQELVRKLNPGKESDIGMLRLLNRRSNVHGPDPGMPKSSCMAATRPAPRAPCLACLQAS